MLARQIAVPAVVVTLWAAPLLYSANARSRVYVAEFRSETLKAKTALLAAFTEQFETALVDSGSYIVLDRRKVNTLLAESNNEINLSLRDLPSTIRDRMQKLENAQGVIFGEVVDDAESGEIVITATMETFDSVKQWKHTTTMKRGLVQDFSQRQQAVARLVAGGQADSSTAPVAPSVDSKPSQAAGANSQQITNSGTIGSVTYNINGASHERKEIKVSPRLLDGYVGDYQMNAYSAATITREGDRLFGQATGQPKFELFAEDERNFFVKVADVQVTFLEPGTDGKATGLMLHQKMGDAYFKRAGTEESPRSLAESAYAILTRFLETARAKFPATSPGTKPEDQILHTYHAQYDALISNALDRLRAHNAPVGDLQHLSANIKTTNDIQLLADGFKKVSDPSARYIGLALERFLTYKATSNFQLPDTSQSQVVTLYLRTCAPSIHEILAKLQSRNISVEQVSQTIRTVASIDDVEHLRAGFKNLAESLPSR